MNFVFDVNILLKYFGGPSGLSLTESFHLFSVWKRLHTSTTVRVGRCESKSLQENCFLCDMRNKYLLPDNTGFLVCFERSYFSVPFFEVLSILTCGGFSSGFTLVTTVNRWIFK